MNPCGGKNHELEKNQKIRETRRIIFIELIKYVFRV